MAVEPIGAPITRESDANAKEAAVTTVLANMHPPVQYSKHLSADPVMVRFESVNEQTDSSQEAVTRHLAPVSTLAGNHADTAASANEEQAAAIMALKVHEATL